MSAASEGSVCVSSATTSSPAWRALSSEGTIALESFGVIIRPFAPAEMRFSTAATCDSLSPSFLPANDCTFAPAGPAALSAPSFIFTKNGFVSVFVISPTLTASLLLEPPLLLPAPPLPLSLPQATTPTPSASAAATTTRRLPLPANRCPVISPPPISSDPWSPENVYLRYSTAAKRDCQGRRKRFTDERRYGGMCAGEHLQPRPLRGAACHLLRVAGAAFSRPSVSAGKVTSSVGRFQKTLP